MAMRTPVILTAGNTHKSAGWGQLVQVSLPTHASDDTDAIVNSFLQILASVDAKRVELDAAMTRMGQTYGLFSQFIQAVVAQSMSEPSSALDVLSRRFADAALASVKTEQGMITAPGMYAKGQRLSCYRPRPKIRRRCHK
ncbi:hypothetical protein N9Q54_02720 [Octadecabacter sp.]|nr:hypothetical protein [Octadecabacter sp.]